METLVVVAQHRNQCYNSGKPEISDRFGSSPSRSFEGINCRTFQSGVGILPSPSAVHRSYGSPPPSKNSSFYSEPPKQSKRTNPIAIRPKTTKDSTFNDDLVYSELWAGPTYSNSPPPSSLPIPKFSLRQNRSISLDLPSSLTGFKIQPLAKSAPPSPTRESSCSSASDFFFTNAYATQGLRRILNLDIADD